MALEVLDDARILTILSNKDFQKDFPKLAEISATIYTLPVSVAKSKCSCNKSKKLKAESSKQIAINAVKNYIKQMTQEEREKFKKALNATEIRFSVRCSEGTIKELRY